MFLGRRSPKADVYINYGDDRISHHRVKVGPNTTALSSLLEVAHVEYTPDEGATDHQGAMVTAIDGFRSDLSHCWIYYVFEYRSSGWRMPMEMPDHLAVSDGMRIGWRYYDLALGPRPRDGPLYTSRCAGKVRVCAREFG